MMPDTGNPLPVHRIRYTASGIGYNILLNEPENPVAVLYRVNFEDKALLV